MFIGIFNGHNGLMKRIYDWYFFWISIKNCFTTNPTSSFKSLYDLLLKCFSASSMEISFREAKIVNKFKTPGLSSEI